MTASNEMISSIEDIVRAKLSEKRFSHTIAVRKMAEKLSKLCMPEYENEIVAASLLHDITKEYNAEAQLELIREYGIKVDEETKKSPAVLHSFTAEAYVKRNYPEFASPLILSSTRNHTLGAPDMSISDMIVFLADYIEETRRIDSCVKTREFVLGNMCEGDIEGNRKILIKACIMSIDYTILHLIEEKKHINTQNVLTRNALLSKI